MTQLFANNAASELASAVTSGAVSLSLKTGDGAKFPSPVGGDFFLVTLYQKVGQDEINHEIVKCTARAGDVLTVVRAQEGTTARAFSVDDPVELRLTAGSVATKDDLTTKQPLDADLTAIAALAGTSGLLKKTAANTWTLDTAAYTANTGTVTSVGVSVPTGLSVTGSPVTASGTIAISYSAGYSIPTTAKQTNWNTAYGWGNHASAGYSKLALGTADGAALAASGAAGSATTAAKSDHVHPFPTAASVGAVATSGGAASGLTLNDGYTEEVFAVTGTAPALSPTNGSIQTWALSGNSTPTAGTWASGQSMTLMVDDGSAYTINWASMSITWKTGGGTAPTLLTSGYTVIELVKVGATIYGWLAGGA